MEEIIGNESQMETQDIQDVDPALEKRKITLSAEEYQKIVQSIFLKLKRNEKSSGVSGMTKSSIINWYLESLEQSQSIEDEESYHRHRKTVKSIINRLINTVLFILNLGTRFARNERCHAFIRGRRRGN